MKKEREIKQNVKSTKSAEKVNALKSISNGIPSEVNLKFRNVNSYSFLKKVLVRYQND